MSRWGPPKGSCASRCAVRDAPSGPDPAHLTVMGVSTWFQGVFLGLFMRVPATVTALWSSAAYRAARRRKRPRRTGVRRPVDVVRQAPHGCPPPPAVGGDPGEPRTVPLRAIVAHMIEDGVGHAGHGAAQSFAS